MQKSCATKMYRSCFAVLSAVAVVSVLFAAEAAFSGFKSFRRAYTARKIIAGCKDYRLSKTTHTHIYYDMRDEEYVRLIEGMIKTYYPLLMEDMNITSDKLITVVIYPGKEEMANAIGYTRSGSPLPMGAYTSGILIILSPALWLQGGDDAVNADDFVKNGPVLHELAHMVFDEKTKGNYAEWFSEGVALYYENKYTGYRWGYKSKIDERVSFRELSGSFKYLNERESYRKSFEIVKYIADEKGQTALKAIFDDLERGKRLNEAIKRQLGKDLYIFDFL